MYQFIVECVWTYIDEYVMLILYIYCRRNAWIKCVYIYIYTYACMYIYIYVYICVYTHLYMESMHILYGNRLKCCVGGFQQFFIPQEKTGTRIRNPCQPQATCRTCCGTTPGQAMNPGLRSTTYDVNDLFSRDHWSWDRYSCIYCTIVCLEYIYM